MPYVHSLVDQVPNATAFAAPLSCGTVRNLAAETRRHLALGRVGQTGGVSSDVLSQRALNRATLERQHLLRRSTMPPLEAVDHLVGLQAQEPPDPYTALWSRLEGFEPGQLGQLILDRKVVRIVVMRTTIHLVTAADALGLRPLFQPILAKELTQHQDYRRPLEGLDLAPVLDYARELLADEPRTPAQFRKAFAEKFPELHAAALAYACRNHLALVQLPPRGVWGQAGQVRYDSVENWLGRPVTAAPSIDDAVLRYLAAFGPSATADVTTWSALTGMREVMDRLRPKLRTFRDERGRELFDLPDAPRPDPETPAPARFLPEYDNLLLSHADRSRFVSDDDRKRLGAAAERGGGVLYDSGMVGVWRTDRDKETGQVALTVYHRQSLAPTVRDEVEGEAHRLLELIAADAESFTVRFTPVA